MAFRLKKNILNIKNPNTGLFEGVPAMAGESAYQIAVRHGFKGTEEDWVKYISGMSGGVVTEALKAKKALALDLPSAIGNGTKPVYFDESGKPVECEISLGGAAGYDVSDDPTTETNSLMSNLAMKEVLETILPGSYAAASHTHDDIYYSETEIDTKVTDLQGNASSGQGYATCSTAAATAAKTASLTSYNLKSGGVVVVKFTNAVPASATLNINSKGAKPIYYKGSAITADVIKAGDMVTFMYNGTAYSLLSIDRWQSDISELNSNLNRIDNGRIYFSNIGQETQIGRVNFDKPFEGRYPAVQLSLFQDNEAPIYFSELQFMVYSTDFNGFNYAIYCKNGTCPAISLVWTAISVK